MLRTSFISRSSSTRRQSGDLLVGIIQTPPGAGQFRQALFEQALRLIPFHNFIPVSCAMAASGSFT